MNRLLHVPILTAIALFNGPGVKAQVQVLEDFTVAPPNWTGFANVNPFFFGTNFGHSFTNHTGGSPGEAGGRMPERMDSVIAYYADTTVGDLGRLSDENVLYASGSFTLSTDTNADDGGFYIGWLTATSENNIDPRRIGVNINARATDSGINYWWRPQANYENVESSSRTQNPPESNAWRDDPIHADARIVPGEVYDFEIAYDGSGTLSVTFSGLGTRSMTLREGAEVFREGASGLNAFGIFTNWSNRNEPNSMFFPFINDLEYTSNAFAPSTLQGDFNDNGVVDAADYTIWRDGLGGAFDQNDYDLWKVNFGATLGSGATPGVGSVAVPEPASWFLLLCGGAAVVFAFPLHKSSTHRRSSFVSPEADGQDSQPPHGHRASRHRCASRKDKVRPSASRE